VIDALIRGTLRKDKELVQCNVLISGIEVSNERKDAPKNASSLENGAVLATSRNARAFPSRIGLAAS
jgi:hypothetical protein